MFDRITNLGLGFLLALAVLSGFAAFSVGTAPGGWVVALHGVTGLGVVVLLPWKTMIARRGLTRVRPGRVTSLALSVFVIVTLLSGVALITGSIGRLGPLTTMQVHVGSGLLALSATLVHYWQRPVKLRKADLSKRSALRAIGTVGVAGILYFGAEASLKVTGAPGRNRRFTGSHEIESGTPPPTVWLNDRTPTIDTLAHRIRLPSGVVTVAEVDSFDDAVTATIDCTGGWYSTNTWSGARLDRLLSEVPGESIVIRSVTGYWRRFPRSQAEVLWLATRIDQAALRPGNGAPVRLVAPGRRGFWWVKWVDSIEVDETAPWWQPPLPLA